MIDKSLLWKCVTETSIRPFALMCVRLELSFRGWKCKSPNLADSLFVFPGRGERCPKTQTHPVWCSLLAATVGHQPDGFSFGLVSITQNVLEVVDSETESPLTLFK